MCITFVCRWKGVSEGTRSRFVFPLLADVFKRALRHVIAHEMPDAQLLNELAQRRALALNLAAHGCKALPARARS